MQISAMSMNGNTQSLAVLRARLKAFRRFYFGAPLTIALFFLPLAWRSKAWYLAGICAAVGLGQSIYWYFLPHYLAPLTAALVGLVVIGLRELWNLPFLYPLVRHLAVAAILLWDAVLNTTGGGVPFANKEFRDYANARAGIEQQLDAEGGRHLVFVQYSDDHPFYIEWIYNRANIDQANIVWARSVDPVSDARLAEYFSGRRVWVAEVDAKPVRISRWIQSNPERTGPE